MSVEDARSHAETQTALRGIRFIVNMTIMNIIIDSIIIIIMNIKTFIEINYLLSAWQRPCEETKLRRPPPPLSSLWQPYQGENYKIRKDKTIINFVTVSIEQLKKIKDLFINIIHRLLEQMEGGSVGGITTVNTSFSENP